MFIICYKKYAYYSIKNEIFLNQMLVDSIGGAQPNVSPKNIEKVIWGFPKDRTEQEIISSRITGIDRLIEVEAESFAKVVCQKQGLMQDLLTGKVEVVPDSQDKGVN